MPLIPFIPVVLIVLLVIIILTMGYVKAPPNIAYIISGMKKEPRVIKGQSAIRIPFFERVDRIHLGIIQMDVRTQEPVSTNDFISIIVDGNANVKIGNSPQEILAAAENFIDSPREELRMIIREVLEGSLREIVGQMELKDLVQDRDAFGKRVEENAKEEMERMGLVIVNFNIQNFSDSNGVINDLGIDNISRIKKEAAIARAESDKEIEIANSRARQEAHEAQVLAERQIEIRQNQLNIDRHQLEAEEAKEKARSDVAYEIESLMQKKNLDSAEIDADIARAERQTTLERQNAILLEEKEKATTITKANVDREAAVIKAESEKEIAIISNNSRQEVALREAQARNEISLQTSEAQNRVVTMEATALAAAKSSEAEGIKALGLAEAEAIREKAEAMALMENASIIEMLLEVLPSVVAAAAAPLEKVDKITMYGSGNTTKLIGDVMGTTSQVMEGVKETTGIDLSELVKNIMNKPGVTNTTIQNLED